ncbi:hypothetical protein [Rhizobium leguminosarum]
MTSEVFESWAIVELMGHRKRPGYAKEVEIAGGKMLRIDIPVSDGDSVTEFYGTPAIYAIRPATEEVCRDMAYRSYGIDPRPVRPVDYRPQASIGSGADEGDEP